MKSTGGTGGIEIIALNIGVIHREVQLISVTNLRFGNVQLHNAKGC